MSMTGQEVVTFQQNIQTELIFIQSRPFLGQSFSDFVQKKKNPPLRISLVILYVNLYVNFRVIKGEGQMYLL